MNPSPNFTTNTIRKCYLILEENGGLIAKKSRTILLDDPHLTELKEPLEFISKNWQDPLTPSIMRLSCETVGGKKQNTYDAALALSLINLSFFLWDDIIDQCSSKLFQPTLSGKFGSGTGLIVGGMVSAKAFSILNNLKFSKQKKNRIYELIWDLLATMATVEIQSLKIRSQKIYSSKDKLWKITTESIVPKTCMKIGAIVGNGSKDEIESLGEFGSCLGIILGLMNDFRVSTNLTLELSDKIKKGNLPYSLLLASERSKPLKKRLDFLITQNSVDKTSIKFVVDSMLRSEVFKDIEKKIDFFVQRAIETIKRLNLNEATSTLQTFIELQPRFFIESIPIFEN